MSHATGEVIAGGKTVAWFLYDGTHDAALSSLWPSSAQAWKRSGSEAESNCACGQPPTDVLLYAGYGGGFYWPAQACLSCRVLVSSISPFDDLAEGRRRDGYPLLLGGKFAVSPPAEPTSPYASVLPVAYAPARAAARCACVSQVVLGPIQSVRLGPTALDVVEEGPGRLLVTVHSLGAQQEFRVSTTDPAKVRAAMEKAFGPGRN